MKTINKDSKFVKIICKPEELFIILGGEDDAANQEGIKEMINAHVTVLLHSTFEVKHFHEHAIFNYPDYLKGEPTSELKSERKYHWLIPNKYLFEVE